MNYKESLVLNDCRSSADIDGLQRKLSELSDLPSEMNDNMIANFAGLVSRTVNVECVKTDDNALCNHWVALWRGIAQKQYMQAYEAFLELCTLDTDENLLTIWNDAIQATEDIEVSETLAPPETLTDDVKKNTEANE